MPFVFDSNLAWTRPIKRRRLTTFRTMARYRQDGQTSPDLEPASNSHEQRYREVQETISVEKAEIRTSDREELIQCIKRGQRPTWVPKPNLEALCAEANTQAEMKWQIHGDIVEDVRPAADLSGPKHLLPTATTEDGSGRPRSAFHTGDFHQQGQDWGNPLEFPRPSPLEEASSPSTYADSPPSWASPSPFGRFHRTTSDPAGFSNLPVDPRTRSRAPSLGSSLSSSFVMRAPTSPLVHATNNPNLDFSPRHMVDHRHEQSMSLGSNPSLTPPGLRRETTVPMRNHQARRSITSFTYQPAPSASTIYPSRQRRLSYASESSPRQKTSMVGSFEESILRGRMSTAPSKPLDFMANIGVMGKGDCPAKLKCPAHVTVPFPAVFYNYPSSISSRTVSDDTPSPYVGTIDLRQHLVAPEQHPRKKRRSGVNESEDLMGDLATTGSASFGSGFNSPVSQQISAPAPSSIGGAYRVPQQGQIQIILKNPENTAVKLFLVPYDLDDMQPGTKTFVRQRSFSTGPIMENILSDKPIVDPLSNKQVLRYLIHLRFCCTGRGRFYLYDNIRVVFANRVPDGKEKLRNEIQLPEPKYSSLGLLTSQLSSRRKSTVAGFSPSEKTLLASPQLDTADALKAPHSPPSGIPYSSVPVPFRLPRTLSPGLSRKENRHPQQIRPPSNAGSSGNSRPTSPEVHVHGFDRSSTSQRGSPVPWGAAIDLQPRSPSPALNGDGLLSQKLRELGRQAARASLEDNRK